MKARNLEKYGHEEGPLPDELYEQYGSWETVLSKAFSVNAGMDACFGLYDDYYDVYIMVGQITEDESLSREYVISLFVDLILGGEADDSDQADIAALFEDGGDASGWFAPELERAAEFIVGYEDGTLRPGGAVTRAETAAFLFRLLSDRGYLGDGGGAPEFSDLPAWAADDINSLFRAGILLGCGGGVFGSDDSLTAEQLRLIVDRVCEMIGRD